MKPDSKTPQDHGGEREPFEELRRRAENQVDIKASRQSLPVKTEDLQRLIHELHVHQIELEIQNEELLQARKEIEAGLERYTGLYDFAPTGYFTLDWNSTIRQVNLTGATMLGKDRSQLIGRRFQDFVTEGSLTTFNDFIHSVFDKTGGKSFYLEFSIKGGLAVLVHAKEAPDRGGEECFITVTDITDRKQAEEGLKESEQRYRSFIEKFKGIAYQATPDWIPIFFHGAVEDITGYTEEDFVSGNPRWDQIISPDDLAEIIARDNEKLLSIPGHFIQREYRIIRKDGEMRWVSDLIQNQVYETGEIFLSGILTDITERKQADEALRKSEGKFRYVFDWANDAILLHNLSNEHSPGLFIEVNQIACEMLGYSREELLTMGPPDIVPSELHPQLREIISQAQKEKKFIFETKLLRKDGTTFPVESNAHLVDYDGGKIWISHIRDITKRKKAEKKLRESEERFRTLFNAAPDSIFIKDRNLRYTLINHGMEQLFSLPAEKLIGLSDTDLFGEEAGKQIQEVDKRVMGGETIEEEHIKPVKGKPHAFHVIKTPLKDPDGYIFGLCGIARDVTERHHAEEALRKSEEQYRNLVENISDVIFAMDCQGIITYISPTVGKIYGYTQEDIKGKHFSDFIHPDDLQGVLEGFSRRIKGEFGENIFRILAKDGTEHYVRTTQTPIIRNGRVTGFNYVMTDFTERRKAEEALRQANKKLNILSSVTRHDILNQIMGIRGHLELSEKMTDDPKLLEYIKIESDAMDLIQRQIEFTRYYQDIGMEEPKWHDIGETIREMLKSMKLDGISIDISLDELEIFADPLVEKVFYNLIENSIRHGEHVTAIGFSYAETDDSIVISYRDNGVGISKEDKKNLFRRGFGRHTGLGLFLSSEILSITGITIQENGEPGKGVCFEIIVPKGDYRFPDEMQHSVNNQEPA